MIKRMLMIAALALGMVSAVSAEIPLPLCLPCPSGPNGN
jgi:hypothetical protein